MKTTGTLFVAALAVSLVACGGGDDSTVDAAGGGGADANVGTVDAAQGTPDAGPGTPDGSPVFDASPPLPDAILCNGQTIDCNGVCIDPLIDNDYCGALGDCIDVNAGEDCAPSAVCDTGVCIDTLENPSFEAGDFTGWSTADLAAPYLPLAVVAAGITAADFNSFATAPTDGTLVALTGFDGAGPGEIIVGQDVTLRADPANATLTFDYRGGWELAQFGAAVDRPFSVTVEPEGGGTPLQTDLIVTAVAGELVEDTGNLIGTVDLTPYLGQTVRINFRWGVPENFTGPAHFQIDNVAISEVAP